MATTTVELTPEQLDIIDRLAHGLPLLHDEKRSAGAKTSTSTSTAQPPVDRSLPCWSERVLAEASKRTRAVLTAPETRLTADQLALRRYSLVVGAKYFTDNTPSHTPFHTGTRPTITFLTNTQSHDDMQTDDTTASTAHEHVNNQHDEVDNEDDWGRPDSPPMHLKLQSGMLGTIQEIDNYTLQRLLTATDTGHAVFMHLLAHHRGDWTALIGAYAVVRFRQKLQVEAEEAAIAANAVAVMIAGGRPAVRPSSGRGAGRDRERDGGRGNVQLPVPAAYRKDPTNHSGGNNTGGNGNCYGNSDRTGYGSALSQRLHSEKEWAEGAGALYVDMAIDIVTSPAHSVLKEMLFDANEFKQIVHDEQVYVATRHNLHTVPAQVFRDTLARFDLLPATSPFVVGCVCRALSLCGAVAGALEVYDECWRALCEAHRLATQAQATSTPQPTTLQPTAPSTAVNTTTTTTTTHAATSRPTHASATSKPLSTPVTAARARPATAIGIITHHPPATAAVPLSQPTDRGHHRTTAAPANTPFSPLATHHTHNTTASTSGSLPAAVPVARSLSANDADADGEYEDDFEFGIADDDGESDNDNDFNDHGNGSGSGGDRGRGWGEGVGVGVGTGSRYIDDLLYQHVGLAVPAQVRPASSGPVLSQAVSQAQTQSQTQPQREQHHNTNHNSHNHHNNHNHNHHHQHRHASGASTTALSTRPQSSPPTGPTATRRHHTSTPTNPPSPHKRPASSSATVRVPGSAATTREEGNDIGGIQKVGEIDDSRRTLAVVDTFSTSVWLINCPFLYCFHPHTHTSHNSHLNPPTSHLTPNTSHLTPHTSYPTPHTPPHTSQLTPHTFTHPSPSPTPSWAPWPAPARPLPAAQTGRPPSSVGGTERWCTGQPCWRRGTGGTAG